MVEIGTRIGMTPEKEKEMKKVAIRQAYRSPIGNLSSPKYYKYSLFVALEVFTLQHLVSQHFLKHLIMKDSKNSVIGVAILKTIVSMTIAPICWYQSEVKSSNLPKKMKLTSFKVAEFLQLQFSRIMISPIFKMSRKARFNANPTSSSIKVFCLQNLLITLKIKVTMMLYTTIPSEIRRGTILQSMYCFDHYEQSS